MSVMAAQLAFSRRAGLVGLLVVALAGIGAWAGPQARAAEEIDLAGTARVTLGINNYCNLGSSAPQRAGTKTFDFPVRVSVSGPMQAGGVREPNPLHLFIGTGSQGPEGSFALVSAHTVATGSGDLLLTYWKLGYDTDTGALTGKLTDSHTREAAAANILFITKDLVGCRPELGTIPFMAAMGNGSELQGTLSRSAAQIRVVGRSVDGLFDYQIDIRAS